MSGIDLGRLDDVMAAVSDVRDRVGRPGYLMDVGTWPMASKLVANDVRELAEAVADLVDVVRDKLAELAADAGRGGGKA